VVASIYEDTKLIGEIPLPSTFCKALPTPKPKTKAREPSASAAGDA